MTKTIRVEGMKCSHCEAHLREALMKLEGVEEVKADHIANQAEITLTKDIPEDVLVDEVNQKTRYHASKMN